MARRMGRQTLRGDGNNNPATRTVVFRKHETDIVALFILSKYSRNKHILVSQDAYQRLSCGISGSNITTFQEIVSKEKPHWQCRGGKHETVVEVTD